MSTPTLSDILSRKLEQKRENHPSFQLMKIDDRLFPNAETIQKSIKLNALDSNNELKTIKEIVEKSWNKKNKNHLMIEGEGGIGKTVTLLSIPDKFAPFPVPAIYIPLHELSKGDDPIEGYIRKKMLNNKEALFEQLLDLVDKPWDKGPQLLLLLDGFNEIATENRPNIGKDIEHWSEYPGIQIITSSRYDIHTYVALGINCSAIKLQTLSITTVENYLKSKDISIPDDDAIKKLITAPLLLTLYAMTEHVLEEKDSDSSDFKVVKNAGSIVWNYLQCELWIFRKENEDAKNAIIAMEFIAPYIAWRMQQKNLFSLNKREFHGFLKEAYQLLEKHFDKTEAFPFHISDAIQKSNGIPPLDLIRSLLEKHLCLFVENGEQYRLMHQQFRDALAAIHLINLSYLSGNSLPQEWSTPIDHFVMQFVADLIREDTDENEALKLWEQNKRTSPAIEDATRNQLRLQGLLHNNDFSHLDFGDLDLSNISLYPYRVGNAKLKLPSDANAMKNVKISEKTFSHEGHKDSVTAIAVSFDGKYIVSGSCDNTIHIWDLETYQSLRTLEGHYDSVTAVAISPDGKFIISGSNDRTIRVWDFETGENIRTMDSDWYSVDAIAVTQNKLIISRSYDTIKIWSLETGKIIRTLLGKNAVAVTLNGKYVVSGSYNTIRIWDLMTDEYIKMLEGHDCLRLDSIFAVTSNGKFIVNVSYEHNIHIWNLETGEIARTLEGHKARITALAITPNEKFIVSRSDDHTLRVWDFETGDNIRTIEGIEYSINAFTITPNGKFIVSGSNDFSIHIWDLETGENIATLEGHKYLVDAVSIMPNEKFVVSGSEEGTIRIWDMETGINIKTIEIQEYSANVATIVPNGRIVVNGSNEGTIYIWDMETGKKIKTLNGHKHRVTAVAITPNGKLVVNGSTDSSIQVWDMETGKNIQTLNGHKYGITSVAITPNGKIVVSASVDCTIFIWDMETGKIVKELEGDAIWVSAVAVTQNGKHAFSGSWDNSIRIWDLETGEHIRTLIGHKNRVTAIAISPNEKYAISGSKDNTIHIWNLETGLPYVIRTLPLSFIGLDFSLADISDPELKETLRQNGAKVDPD